MDSDKKLVEKIIKRHGPVLDLRQKPEVIIDILRKFGPIGGLAAQPDGGTLPGGTPTGPTSFVSNPGDVVTNDELMKHILKLTRDVGKIRKGIASK